MFSAGVRELKNKTSEILGKVKKEGGVIVTNNGKPIAGIIPLDEDDVEDFLIAHNPKIRAAMIRGAKDYEAGRVHRPEDLLKELKR
ncbi:MAG: type II toxin-antitoxin system prevent-host-death family antitoxin [Actinobacteria bacterium]|nr:type II toxin-antitoxin system prevent-host-death family antitoxin [Actinomycetota bacterium]